MVRYVLGLAGCLLACLLYYFFVVTAARLDVDIVVYEDSVFKVYWAADGEGFSEWNSAGLRVSPGRSTYSLHLRDLADIDRLRIDTHEYAGEIILRELTLSQDGFTPIVFSRENGYAGLHPQHAVETVETTDLGLLVRSTGGDPQLEYQVVLVREKANIGLRLLRFLLVAGLAFVIFSSCARSLRDFSFVPVLLFGAWLLIVVMAGTSKENVHPDEYVHIAAVSYYADHWFPPRVDDPEILDSYSVYGVSRLHSLEVYYFFAGKICRLLQNAGLPGPVAYRGLNVILFAFLVLFAMGHLSLRVVLLPLLASSQLWYLFAYCNSDAFSLFCSFLAAWQLVEPKSFLHRFLQGKGGGQLARLALLAVCLGILLLMKRNYYAFLGLFFVVLVLQILYVDAYQGIRKEGFRRLTAVCLLAFCVWGVRVGTNYLVNGLDFSENLKKMQIQTADQAYRADIPLKEQRPSLRLKDRGYTFKEMETRLHWGMKTFQSSFGVYGYLSLFSPDNYYRVVQWLGLFALAVLSCIVVGRGGFLGIASGAVAAVLGIALVGASAYHSWVADFQPQGRYLFPLAPMIGVVVGMTNGRNVARGLLLLAVGFLYMFAVYSFVFSGLYRIPKLVL